MKIKKYGNKKWSLKFNDKPKSQNPTSFCPPKKKTSSFIQLYRALVNISVCLCVGGQPWVCEKNRPLLNRLRRERVW